MATAKNAGTPMAVASKNDTVVAAMGVRDVNAGQANNDR